MVSEIKHVVFSVLNVDPFPGFFFTDFSQGKNPQVPSNMSKFIYDYIQFIHTYHIISCNYVYIYIL